MLRKACTNKNMFASLGLLAILVLGQSTLFDWLIDTIPGRIVMIALIMGISYMNNTLGVVAVLLIIIMFNQSDIALFEGFTAHDRDNITDTGHHHHKHHRKDRVTKVTEDSSNNILLMDASGNIKARVKNYLHAGNNMNGKHKSRSGPRHFDNMPNRRGSDTTTEGFDNNNNIVDMEDTIKRGKPSDTLSTQVPDPRNIDTSKVQAYSGFSTSTYSYM